MSTDVPPPARGAVDDDSGLSQAATLRVLNVVVATPKARGGAVRAGLSLGHALRSYVDVDTVKMRGSHDAALASELGIQEIRTIPSRTVVRDSLARVAPTAENVENTLIWTRLSSPHAVGDYDLVHVHNAVPLGGMAAVALQCRLAGVPYCVTAHGISKLPELPESTSMSRLQRSAFELLFMKPYLSVLRNAAHRFALSERDRRALTDRFPGRSVSVVPNGVTPNPPTVHAAGRVAAATGIAESTPLVLFVGKLMRSKGIDDLLAAYRQLDTPATLVVVGPAEDDSYVDRLEATDGVEYLGYVDQPTLEALYQRSDVFAFPTRSDVFPLVTLEAMAAATPVVATAVGGLPEQVTDGAGILVPPRDPRRVAEAIDRLLCDGDLRAQMGARALTLVRDRYSWDVVARATARTYVDVVEEAQR